MSDYARIENGRVMEIIPSDVESGFPLKERYPEHIVKTCVECPPEVEPGWFYSNGNFTPLSPPSDEEQYYAERSAVDVKYSAPWNGSTGGILIMLQMAMSAAQCEVPQNSEKIAGISAEYQAELAAMRAELQTIDEKYGV